MFPAEPVLRAARSSRRLVVLRPAVPDGEGDETRSPV
jgi:hypothetical protein